MSETEEVHSTVHRSPSTGDTVPVPTEATTDVQRVGTPNHGRQTLVITTVGTGDTETHVVIRESPEDERVEVPSGAHVFGVDPADGDNLYGIPASEYGGGSDV